MIEGTSLNITVENLEKLRTLFPSIFSEGKIDIDRLKAELGQDVFTEKEHYELSWAGKSEARKEIQRQTTATLCRDTMHGVSIDTNNIFIEGENLETLKVLQKSYFGKIKMIYIDLPYNTGNDSFNHSTWLVFMKNRLEVARELLREMRIFGVGGVAPIVKRHLKQ